MSKPEQTEGGNRTSWEPSSKSTFQKGKKRRRVITRPSEIVFKHAIRVSLATRRKKTHVIYAFSSSKNRMAKEPNRQESCA